MYKPCIIQNNYNNIFFKIFILFYNHFFFVYILHDLLQPIYVHLVLTNLIYITVDYCTKVAHLNQPNQQLKFASVIRTSLL